MRSQGGNDVMSGNDVSGNDDSGNDDRPRDQVKTAFYFGHLGFTYKVSIDP